MNAKKAKRTMRKKPHMGTAVHGRARILIGTITPTLNVNNPGTVVSEGVWTSLNVIPSRIEELSVRAAIYSKFKIRKTVYHFVRDNNPNRSDEIVNIAVTGNANTGAFSTYAFRNTFNRLLPSVTSGNTPAIVKWLDQQSGVKRIGPNVNRFSIAVPGKVTRVENLAGPSQVTPGATVDVNREMKCPWLDLENDLTDDMSLCQLSFFQRALDVNTNNALSTTAGQPGLSLTNLQDMFRWRVYADVSYSCKGKFLDRRLV